MNSPFLKLLFVVDLRGGKQVLRRVHTGEPYPPTSEDEQYREV
jgi:uncharacterized protein related to proFAR isomerase